MKPHDDVDRMVTRVQITTPDDHAVMARALYDIADQVSIIVVSYALIFKPSIEFVKAQIEGVAHVDCDLHDSRAKSADRTTRGVKSAAVDRDPTLLEVDAMPHDLETAFQGRVVEDHA